MLFFVCPLDGTAVNGRWGRTRFLYITSAWLSLHSVSFPTQRFCSEQCKLSTATIPNYLEAQWTNLIGPSSGTARKCLFEISVLSELPVNNLKSSSGWKLTDS